MRKSLTQEHKEKISKAMKGINNPNYGGLSILHKNNIRKGMLGYWIKVRKNDLKSV